MNIFAQYQDLATPRVKKILSDLGPAQRKSMLTRLGKELEVQLKKHFAQREQDSPNKQGFPRSHFWAREVAAKTAFREATPDRATVGIASRPFAFKLRGGTIKPGPGRRLLALPMRPEAYGVLPRAGTIAGLGLMKSKQGKLFLGTPDPDDARFPRYYFRLVPSVHQDADPRALPPAADLQKAIEQRAEQELQRVLQQRT